MSTKVFSAALRRAAATVAAAGALTALAATPAAAHDELLSTIPEEGAVLETAPEEIELAFSGEIMDIGHEVAVTDSTGESITTGELTPEGTRVIQPLADAGAEDETYRVVWRVVSSDGHPIEGTYTYDVDEGADTAAPAQGADSAPISDGTDGAAQAQDTAADGATAGTPLWAVGVAGAVFVLIVAGFVALASRRRRKG